jgi:lysozyme
MDYREKYQKMLIRDEDLRLKAYKCPAGYWTLGVGRNIQARGVTGLKLLYYRTVGITREEAMKWLDEDVATAERDCSHVFGDALFDSWSENRRLGWVNFLFNLGRDRALSFRNTLQAAREQRWARVELGLKQSLWYRQVGPKRPKHDNRADRVIAMICHEEFPYG